MEVTTWPDRCKCGQDAHHYVYTDAAKTKYEHLCDECLLQHLDTESGAAMSDTLTVRIPWGSFGRGGLWMPNALLEMSAEEQCRQNNENGYPCELPTTPKEEPR